MTRDISYCATEECPFTDCLRHLKQLDGEPAGAVFTLSNFGGICRKYIAHREGEAFDSAEDLYMTDN